MKPAPPVTRIILHHTHRTSFTYKHRHHRHQWITPSNSPADSCSPLKHAPSLLSNVCISQFPSSVVQCVSAITPSPFPQKILPAPGSSLYGYLPVPDAI